MVLLGLTCVVTTTHRTVAIGPVSGLIDMLDRIGISRTSDHAGFAVSEYAGRAPDMSGINTIPEATSAERLVEEVHRGE